MKKGVLFIVGSFLFLHSFSQARTDTAAFNPNVGLLIYFGVGASYNNYKNLNTILQNEALPTVGKFGVSALIAEDVRLQNWLIGINENVSSSQKRPDNYTVSLFNAFIGASAGYYVINHKQFHLAPAAGIGLTNSNIKLTQRKNVGNFTELLQNKNSIDINQNVAALDCSLHFSFADFTKRRTDVTNIKLGYRYGLKQQGWGVDENSSSTVAGSPKDRIRQFYILLCTGLSRIKPRN